ncbi:hypothetical protein, partial [Natronobacillus azotifigens]|uniref:hypothetical protein n=1 Tax=Natronobacillus azotifigens TaxID=472978 RepID=UPI003D25AFEC
LSKIGNQRFYLRSVFFTENQHLTYLALYAVTTRFLSNDLLLIGKLYHLFLWKVCFKNVIKQAWGEGELLFPRQHTKEKISK